MPATKSRAGASLRAMRARTEGGGGGRGEAPRRRRDQDAPARAKAAHGDVAKEGHAGNQGGHDPDFMQVQKAPGINGAVRQQRQQQKRHGKQDQTVADLGRGQSLDPGVQNFAQGQQGGGDDGHGHGHLHVPDNRQRTQQKGQKARQRRGDAEAGADGGLAPLERREDRCKAQKHHSRQGHAKALTQHAGHAAGQSGQGIAAHARGMQQTVLVAHVPAALDPGQKSDGKADAEAQEKVEVFHGTTVGLCRRQCNRSERRRGGWRRSG